MDKIKKTIAIVPGSFDPITNGHIDIIERAAEMYDVVYVAVMINDSKKYMFTLEERERIAKACFEGRDNIIVISSDGWLWELAKRLGAMAIVKGYRNDIDLQYEKNMAAFNEEKFPECKTVLLESKEQLSDISSTYIRTLINEKKPLQGLIPDQAISVINSLN